MPAPGPPPYGLLYCRLYTPAEYPALGRRASCSGPSAGMLRGGLLGGPPLAGARGIGCRRVLVGSKGSLGGSTVPPPRPPVPAVEVKDHDPGVKPYPQHRHRPRSAPPRRPRGRIEARNTAPPRQPRSSLPREHPAARQGRASSGAGRETGCTAANPRHRSRRPPGRQRRRAKYITLNLR